MCWGPLLCCLLSRGMWLPKIENMDKSGYRNDVANGILSQKKLLSGFYWFLCWCRQKCTVTIGHHHPATHKPKQCQLTITLLIDRFMNLHFSPTHCVHCSDDIHRNAFCQFEIPTSLEVQQCTFQSISCIISTSWYMLCTLVTPIFVFHYPGNAFMTSAYMKRFTFLLAPAITIIVIAKLFSPVSHIQKISVAPDHNYLSK